MATNPSRRKNAAPAPAAPELDTEVASRLRDPFETLYLGVLRTQDPLLLERGNEGAEIYRDLKRDGKVFSALQKRILALVSKPWQVEPVDGTSLQDAEALTAILKGFAFDKLCQELMEAVLCGWALGEIVWTRCDNRVVPARVAQRARRRFRYVQDEEHASPALHLLTREDMTRGTPIPDRKFIVHRVNPEDDNPYGSGLGLQLYWPVYFKRAGVVAWNKLNDRFGTPTLWGRFPRNAGKKEKDTLFEALRAFSRDGVVMTPEGTLIELLESKVGGNITTQQALCEYMDDWIDAVILGTEPRSKSGGAMAAASKERQDVRLDLVQADSDLLSETLNNTLIRWLCEYNDLAPCQVYRVIKEEDDLKAQAETDNIVSEMGFELSLDQVRARYGEGWEKKASHATAPGSVPVVGTAKPGGDQPEPGATARFAESGARDVIDDAIDDAVGDWEAVITPMTDPILAAIAEADAAGETAEQLLQRLGALLTAENAPDAGPLAERLAQLAGAARLAGTAGAGV